MKHLIATLVLGGVLTLASTQALAQSECKQLPREASNVDANAVSAPADKNTRCLALGDKTIGFGQITQARVKAAQAVERLMYAGNTKRLAVGRTGNASYLRQKLVPNRQGSERVSGGAYLQSARTVTISQRVMFEKGFDWGGKNVGGKLGVGIGGGSSPSGGQVKKDGFTARFMWRGDGKGGAYLAVYSYEATRPSKWGKDYPMRSHKLTAGQWVDLRLEVTANSATNKRDGRLRAWVNDKLLIDQKRVGWQTAGGKPWIDRLIYSTFHGGGDRSWSPSRTNYIRFMNVCWSRR